MSTPPVVIIIGGHSRTFDTVELAMDYMQKIIDSGKLPEDVE